MEFKNALVATTAICAVGGLGLASAEAAEKPKLKISGYYEIYAGIADADRDNQVVDGSPVFQGDHSMEEGTFNIVHYGEIRFRAEGQTDSGMKWGVYFEDVQDDFDADNAGQGSGAEKQSTDEANIWLSGSWGKLELGGQDGAGDRMYRSGQDLVHINPNMLDVFADTQTEEGGRGMAREKMNINDSGDATKITYYTPRISGFQAGYSWIPEIDSKGSFAKEGNASGDSFATAAHEFGVGYRGKIGGGSLRVEGGGTIMTGDTSEDSSSTETSNFGWRLGFNYSHGPWTVGAGYKDAGEWSRFDEEGDHTGFDVGVAYNGGRWEVALVHISTDAEDDEGDLEWDHTMLSGAYNLGGGLTATAMLNMFSLDDPQDSTEGGNDGWAIILGLGARF